MKHTKKFLGIMRIAFGIAAFLVVALCAIAIGIDLSGFYKALEAAWPYAAAVFGCYIVFSLAEDFINNRMLRPHF